MAKSFSDMLQNGFIEPEEQLPLGVLEELRDALSKKVANRISFEIMSTSLGDRVTHSFRVIVQALGDYTAELFKISHRIAQLYPVRIQGFSAMASIEAADEDELREKLGSLITSKSFQKTIGTLLAQA